MIRAGDNFYSRHHSPFTDNMLSQLKLSVINRLKSPKSIDYKSIPWPNFFMERGEFLSEAILSNQNHSIEDRAKNLINALKEANRIEQIYLPKHNAYIKAISLKSNPKNSIDMRKQLYRFIDGNFNYQSQDLFRRDLSIRDMKVQVMETLNSSQHHAIFDSSRGVLKRIGRSRNNAEDTDSSFLSSFDTDGFSWSSGGDNTQNGSYNYVSW